jgi:hypothetical protein
MLILPGGPAFQYCKDNIEGGSSLSPGSAATPGTANVAGTAVTIATVSPLAKDACLVYMQIGFSRTTTSTIDRSQSMDLLIDPAGGTSWSSLIDGILVGAWMCKPALVAR